MPRRKATPKPKRRAASRAHGAARTQAQQDYARFSEATNAAARAALAPLQGELEKLTQQITARQRLVLKDIAAAIRAQAESRGEYALVLPTPSHALIARNAEHAAQAYPDSHSWSPAPYLSQTSMLDEPQERVEYFAQLTAGVSAPARVLLSLIAGRWADTTYDPACPLPQHAADGSCKHARERAIPYTLNALARDLYESAGGKQVEQVSALLEELESVRITYGITDTADPLDEKSAGKPYEPLISLGLKGRGVRGESRGNLQRHLVLARGLHDEYLRGSYRRVRRSLLVGWTGWQQELALRLYGHSGTYYGSRRLKSQSADGLRGRISLGKVAPLELGALADLLPSYADNPAALQRKLEEFAAEVNRRSEPQELHLGEVHPIRKGRHLSGWELDFYYPEKPLTAKQRRVLKAAEVKRELAQIVRGAERAEAARTPVHAPQEESATYEPPEQPIGVEVNEFGYEVVVLPPAKPRREAPSTCSHGVAFTLQPAGVSRAGKPYEAFYQARHRLDSGGWCRDRRPRT